MTLTGLQTRRRPFAVLLLLAVLSACGESPDAGKPSANLPQEPPATALPASESPEARAGRQPVFTLQLNAFRGQENADRYFDSLQKKGLKPYMVSTVEERPWYKVRIGPYEKEEDARTRQRELMERHGLRAVVLPQQAITGGGPRAAAGAGPMAVSAETGGDHADQVVARFLIWIQAWQNIDIDTFLSFYARDFENPGVTREAWLKKQRKALSRVRRVKVEVGEVRIREEGDTVLLSFVQNYWSNLRADVSHKTMVWKKEDGEWKILREIAKPA